jgi:pyruvate formate lyase activating enzyme
VLVSTAGCPKNRDCRSNFPYSLLPYFPYNYPMNLTGSIFDIRRYTLHDGPGIRTTVFLKGCPLSCWWCHNPESRSSTAQVMVRENLCVRCGECAAACMHGAVTLQDDGPHTDAELCELCGACVAACAAGARELVGRTVTPAEVLAELQTDIPFFDESGGGVTFSGGEPLQQPEFLAQLLTGCKVLELHTAVDTSGYAPWQVLQGLLDRVDLFLYDLKCIDDQRHQHYTGVSNGVILHNLARLQAAGADVIVRIPIIPGLNDDESEISAAGQFCARLGIRRVDLLPYHASAGAKYRRLGIPYALEQVAAPADEHMQALSETLKALGLDARVGGG